MRFRVLNGLGGAGAPWRGALALSADSQPSAARPPGWMLLNPSAPVVARLKLESTWAGVITPGGGLPVLLTDARGDAPAGLASLRGGLPVELYATPAAFEDLTASIPMAVPGRRCEVHWHIVPVAGDTRAASFQVLGHESLSFTAYDLSPPASGRVDERQAPPGQCIALGVRDLQSGQCAVFARGPDAMALSVLGALDDAVCLLVDAGPTEPAAQRALMAWMSTLAISRKVLLGPSPRQAGEAGVECAGDGQVIVV